MDFESSLVSAKDVELEKGDVVFERIRFGVDGSSKLNKFRVIVRQISVAFSEALKEVNPRHSPLVEDAIRSARKTGGFAGIEVRYLLDERGWPDAVHIVRDGNVVEVITRRDVPMEPPPEELWKREKSE